MNATLYVARMRPYADQASAATGLPADVILAQWGVETGWGTSNLARNHNNHGGIKWVGGRSKFQAYESGSFAGYKSIADFVADYSRVLNLSYYAHVRAAARAGASPGQVALALGNSPYDEGEYAIGGVKGQKIVLALGQFGGQTVAQPAKPSVSVTGPGAVAVTVPGQIDSAQIIGSIAMAAGAIILIAIVARD